MNKHGILLINLGTPENYSLKAIRRYLRQFLSDWRVIDLNFFLRFFLVNFIILPFRSKKTAAAYQKIWSTEGSPLLNNSNRIKEALARELGENYQVELGMRYGTPSIKTALSQFNNCDKISVLPLFPQYSSAATGSAISEFLKAYTSQWNIPNMTIKRDFYNDPNFIRAYAEIIQKNIVKKNPDVILFSYHSLPERHLIKSKCRMECSSNGTCGDIQEANQYCYKAQCYVTSALLAKALHLTSNQYRVAFQSRLGKTPWIGPYTDVILPQLIQEGIKNIAVVCPSFIVDCLETLEEINIRARSQWEMLGGETFTFIPCLNDEPEWIKALAAIVK